MNASTSPSKVGKSVHFDAERSNVSGPSNHSSSNASASYSYILSLASSVQVLDESLNDERKLLSISQHQHHSSVAKIAELERTVEHLQAQFERSETVNQRIMQRANALESALHSWNFQKMTQDSELHSTHLLVRRSAAQLLGCNVNPLFQIAELNQQNIRLSNDLHVHLLPSLSLLYC
jgi:chromosome segregation ATPase